MNERIERSDRTYDTIRIREGVDHTAAQRYEQDLKNSFSAWMRWETLRGKASNPALDRDAGTAGQEELKRMREDISENAERARTAYYRLNEKYFDFYESQDSNVSRVLHDLQREKSSLQQKLG